MVTAAMIRAAAVLAQTRIGPEIYGFPIIVGAGVPIAGFTGIGVVFDILHRLNDPLFFWRPTGYFVTLSPMCISGSGMGLSPLRK